jgi:hypothetical protein
MLKINTIIICGIIIYFIYIIYCQINRTEHFLKDKISNLNIIIAGTCMNVEMYIKNILSHIDRCGSKFNSYHVIIFENDSVDKTRELLIEYKKNNYTYIFKDGMCDKEKSRTRRLAYARNQILEKVRELNNLNNYDYLLLLDMDNVNENGTFVETIDRCFENNLDTWDMMGANQFGDYYDKWALRKSGQLNYDCWLKVKKHGNTEKAKNKYVKTIKYTYEDDGILIPVTSAFGGTAIYKLNSIPKKCVYKGYHLTGDDKCEHVDFNKCIKKNGGKLFINTLFYNDG